MSHSLDKFYESLDNLTTNNLWSVNKQLMTVDLDLKGKQKSIIETERKILSLSLNKGFLIRQGSVDVTGKVISEIFNEDELSYLSQRLQQTQNIFLLSRYAHILWSQYRNNRFAKIAIENYLAILGQITEKDLSEIHPIFSALFYLSNKSKINTEAVKSITYRFLKIESNWIVTNILYSVLENNIFNHSELDALSSESLKTFNVDNPINYFNNKKLLEVLLVIYDKIKKPKTTLYELLAKNEDVILEHNNDDNSFIKLTTMGEKAMYLKKAKKFVEYQIALNHYTKLKSTVNLPKHSIPLSDDLNELLNTYLESRGEAILKLSTENILAFFMVENDLVVDPSENRRNAIENFNKSITSLFNSSILDINANFKYLENEGDKIEYHILQSYIIHHNIRFYTLFLYVFRRAILLGKINYYLFIEFLREHTWFGMKFKRNIGLQQIDEHSSWISMLAPGIYSFFSEFEMYTVLHTNRTNNYILSIDSLTLKFEGAVRDFIRLCGGSTTVEKKNHLQEQLIEELLENETLKMHFEESDIELFKHIFTRKGKNIRNNVAHSFMEYSDYNLQTASSILFCILRLGKYTFDIDSSN